MSLHAARLSIQTWDDWSRNPRQSTRLFPLAFFLTFRGVDVRPSCSAPHHRRALEIEGGCTTLHPPDSWHCHQERHTPLIFPSPDKGTAGIVGIPRLFLLPLALHSRRWRRTLWPSSSLFLPSSFHDGLFIFRFQAVWAPIHLTLLLGNIYAHHFYSSPSHAPQELAVGTNSEGSLRVAGLARLHLHFLSCLVLELGVAEAEQNSFWFWWYWFQATEMCSHELDYLPCLYRDARVSSNYVWCTVAKLNWFLFPG